MKGADMIPQDPEGYQITRTKDGHFRLVRICDQVEVGVCDTREQAIAQADDPA